MSQKVYVLYHAHCADGFGAAFACWHQFGATAHYLPVRYGDPLPEIPDGATVYIVDFSFPREVLLELAQRCATLRVIDHHKTAQAALDGLPFVTFDGNKSGAVLTWEYLFPEMPVPELLLYVQDRDLWQWRLPESREVSAAMMLRPFDFEIWSWLDVEQLRQEGRVALRLVRQTAERQARQADWREVAGHRVPVVNATACISETCEAMKSLWPSAPFVASYFVTAAGNRVWSLRSGPDFDVSAVASRFPGGGGHRQAAGFTEEVEEQDQERGAQK